MWTLLVALVTSEAGSPLKLACADATDQNGDAAGRSAHPPVRNGEERS